MRNEASFAQQTPFRHSSLNIGAVDIRAAAILFVAAVVLALPMFLFGSYSEAADLSEHLMFNRDFSAQLWSGELYPRWLVAANHGLGSPSFLVFPPLQAYVFAAIRPLLSTMHAMEAEQFLVLFLSGITVCLWLSSFAEQRAAVIGAMFYMAAPYHLWINFYQRDALPECWALVWMPLLLYFTQRIIARGRGADLGFAFTFALFVLSHLISVLIFSLVPIALIFVFSKRTEIIRSLLSIMKAMAIGSALAGFYLLPALHNSRNFPPSTLIPPLDTYLIGSGFLHVRSYPLKVELSCLAGAALCAVGGIFLWRKGNLEGRKLIMFWTAIGLAAAFMNTSLSTFVWHAIPPLLTYIQYPSRLQILVCLAQAVTVAFLVPIGFSRVQFASPARLILLLLVVVPWIGETAGIMWDYHRFNSPPKALMEAEGADQGFFDGWIMAWPPRGTNLTIAQAAAAGPPVRFMQGQGNVTVLSWIPRHIELAADSASGGDILLRQLYYPSWRAVIGSTGLATRLHPEMPSGLIALTVPPGKVDVHLDLPTDATERIGGWLSLAAVFLCIVLVFRESKLNRIQRQV